MTTMTRPGWISVSKLENNLTLVNEEYAQPLQYAASRPVVNDSTGTGEAETTIRSLTAATETTGGGKRNKESGSKSRNFAGRAAAGNGRVSSKVCANVETVRTSSGCLRELCIVEVG